MNNENLPNALTQDIPILSLHQSVSKADDLRNRRATQVRDACFRRVLDELNNSGYSLTDLLTFSDGENSTTNTAKQVEVHRARRHNAHTQIENRIKAVEARKVGRQVKNPKG